MKLVKGKNAETAKGFRHNIEAMKKAGYSNKRARGAAYGEDGMAHKASRDESAASKGIIARSKGIIARRRSNNK